MGLFYRCIVTHTLFGEVIDDISWNYIPEPGSSEADSESSNLIPFSERCLHVFNPTSTAAQEPVLGR